MSRVLHDLERTVRVRILLESLDDPLPSVRGVALASQPGPAPSRRVPCGCTPRQLPPSGSCLLCEGTGWRLPIPGFGPDREQRYDEYLYDPADAKPLTIADEDHDAPFVVQVQALAREVRKGETRFMSPRELDASLERIAQEERSRAGDFDHEAFGWERAREAQDRNGSYAELRRVLRVLECANERLYRATLRAPHWPISAHDELPLATALGVRVVARGMRGEVRVPSWLDGPLQRFREGSVAELYALGVKPNQIAKRLGIRRDKVLRMVAELQPLAA